jgi:hypothetical protein
MTEVLGLSRTEVRWQCDYFTASRSWRSFWRANKNASAMILALHPSPDRPYYLPMTATILALTILTECALYAIRMTRIAN